LHNPQKKQVAMESLVEFQTESDMVAKGRDIENSGGDLLNISEKHHNHKHNEEHNGHNHDNDNDHDVHTHSNTHSHGHSHHHGHSHSN